MRPLVPYACASLVRAGWPAVLPVALVLVAACGGSVPDSDRILGSHVAGTGDEGGASAGSQSAGQPDFGGGPAPAAAEPAGETAGEPVAAMAMYDAQAVLDGSCASAMVETELLPTNVLFVLDRSASMICNPPPTTDSKACEEAPTRADSAQPSKWEITIGALNDAVSALPQDTNVGLSYFSNDDRCGVNSTPSVELAPNTATQQTTIANSLLGAEPGGGTPLVGATILAYKHMHEEALAGRIAGNRFVVLITDGAQSEMCSNPPQCESAESCTDLLLQEEVPRAAGKGVRIRTFAIGVPGSEPSRSVLSQIALSGGTALEGCNVDEGNCHFDMTSVPDLAEALADALVQIADRAVTCELDVPQPMSGGLDLDLLNVVYTPGDGAGAEVVYQDTRAPCDEGADGWQFTEDNTRIRLCGPSCARIRADPGARVDVVIGCPVQAPD